MTETLDPQLVMQRDDLEGLPPVALLPGYALRTFREGEEEEWARVVGAAFERPWTAADFDRIMRQDPMYRADRIYFIVGADGRPCATASAWRVRDGEGGEIGYLHYVATHPDCAGRHLGAQVSLAMLHRFREDGLCRAVLQTDDYRLAAIATYLRLGFHPVLIHKNQHARWAAIKASLGVKGDAIPEKL